VSDHDQHGRLVSRWTSLRPMTPDDLEFVYSLILDPDLGGSVRYQGAVPSFDDFARHAWDGVLVQWVVSSRRRGVPVGLVVISSPDFRNGYAFISVIGSREVVSSGLLIDAVACAIDNAFETWPFRMLYAEVAADHLARFASVVGRYCVEEGRRREQVYFNGRFQDVHLLTVPRRQWEAVARPRRRRFLARARDP
jgi:RimJ/RimL family protein N-acetyltransferase